MRALAFEDFFEMHEAERITRLIWMATRDSTS